MADRDPLAQSLSEEESDQIIPPPDASTSVPPGVPAEKKKKATPSPARKKGKGYKFSDPKLTESNFDFASQSKNGQANNNSNSSSDEGYDNEEFVHIDPEADLNGLLEEEAGAKDSKGKSSAVPTTPSKLTTPHKRTAELATAGAEDAVTGGANGSPPSSPAPKKRFKDYVAEEDAKKEAKDNVVRLPLRVRVAHGLRERHREVALAVVVLIMALVVANGVNLVAKLASALGMTSENDARNYPYDWRNASVSFCRDIKQLEMKLPNQNRETWIQLIASINSTLGSSESNHPAVITVLLPPSLPAQFSTCFLKKVGLAVNTAVAPILQGVNFSRTAPPVLELSPKSFELSMTELRYEIDIYLKEKGKAFVVFDVDKVTKESDLLLFHGLCDNFHAIDKRATVLFPVRVPQKIYQKYKWTHARGGDISTDVLNEAFSKVVSEDTGPALVARIADAVILLNEGDQC